MMDDQKISYKRLNLFGVRFEFLTALDENPRDGSQS